MAGWWEGLIGHGKTIDTDRYFAVSSNMLGSSYGSTAPASVNPATGTPYGPDFPAITLGDIVCAQRLLLDSLGVQHLVAVAGPSFGGYQAFQWAVRYPTHMDGIAPVVTAPKGFGGEAAVTQLAATIPAAARDARLSEMAQAWARTFDPNSMIALRRASVRFDAERDLSKIRARVLYVLSRTDKLFPPSLAPDVMAKLAAAKIDAKYFEIDTDFGHLASGGDWAKWAPALGDFLATLERSR